MFLIFDSPLTKHILCFICVHSLLMEGMKEASDPRIITVGSVTGNDNTVGGGGVYPIADLKQLEGFHI